MWLQPSTLQAADLFLQWNGLPEQTVYVLEIETTICHAFNRTERHTHKENSHEVH